MFEKFSAQIHIPHIFTYLYVLWYKITALYVCTYLYLHIYIYLNFLFPKLLLLLSLTFVVMHKFAFLLLYVCKWEECTRSRRNQPPTCRLRKMLNELKSEHLFMSSGLSTLQIILSVSELYLQQS